MFVENEFVWTNRLDRMNDIPSSSKVGSHCHIFCLRDPIEFNDAEALLWLVSVSLNQLNGIGWDEFNYPICGNGNFAVICSSCKYTAMVSFCLAIEQVSTSVNWMSCFRSIMEWVMINCTLEGKPLVGAHYCNLWTVPIRGRRRITVRRL